MKNSKSYKIITVILAVLFALSIFFAFSSAKSVKADTSFSPDTYFGGDNLSFENDNLVKKITPTSDTLTFKNSVAINDFEIKASAITDVKKITITVKTNSFFHPTSPAGVGVYNEEDSENKTEIENVIVLDIENGKFSLNNVEKESISDFTSVKLSVDNNNVLSATVDEVKATNTDGYYTVYGRDKVKATISFKFELASGKSVGYYKLFYVDQGVNVTEHPYRQTFELKDGGNGFNVIALERVSLGESVIKNENDGLNSIKLNSIKVIEGRETTFSFSALSLLGTTHNYKIGETAEFNGVKRVWKENDDNPNIMSVYGEDGGTLTMKINNGSAVIETYKVTVVKKENDKIAPSYKKLDDIKSAIKAVGKSLNNSLEKDYVVNGENVKKYVRLGSSITVPNMQSLINEDLFAAYNSLSHVTYYKTPTSSTGSTTASSITLSGEGDYQYYTLFKDENGNILDKEIVEKALSFGVSNDLQATEIDDVKVRLVNFAENINIVEIDKDGNDTVDEIVPIFYFSVLDNAPLFVESITEQADGYIGVEYTATAFNIVDSNISSSNISDPVYKLFYNKNVNASADDDGWVEIPAKSSVVETYDENGFDYDDIKSFNYDGKLTFTPIKGAYKISCQITSTRSDRTEKAFTSVIKVSEKPAKVKPATHWLRNNAWSVTFLSVGVLCLAGIVVLLFTKPKEVAEDDE
ncbi:MAG: hypothetical protein MJ066_04125 [Clostridia bacterium]|nr:hypothetical protein [Clostridia bacterium]